MRTAALAAALLALASLAGCGRSTEEDEAKGSVKRFLSAVAIPDGPEACDLLTPRARAALVTRYGARVRARDCGTVMARVGETVLGVRARQLLDAKVTDPRIRGEQATVLALLGRRSDDVPLEMLDGDWRLDEPDVAGVLLGVR